jgi:hypothetical protein
MKVLVLAVLFIASDIVIGVALVALLCYREYSDARSVEWMLSRRRRRRWYFLVTLAVLAYASLAPVFLTALIRVMRQ